jgi:LacI family transcriptional regulator
MMSSRPPRLSDVARQAGVSVSTAARVLRDGPNRVNPELAARVVATAESLGYTTNLMARGLRAGSPPLLGLMVGDMLDPYFAAISESITLEADDLGLAAMVANMRRDPLREIELLRRFLQHRVSGVVLSGGGYDQDTHRDELAKTVATLERAGCHIASLSDRGLGVPTFGVDNEAVGRLAARTILNMGHADVAVVYAPPRSEVTRDRRAATMAELEDAGASVTEIVSSYTREAGLDAARRVFEQHNHVWPSAVIAGSDSLAVGILAHLRSRGIRVPEQVSVIGVGDTYHAESVRLSTIAVALDARSRAAVKHLAALVAGETSRGGLTAEPYLVDRGSIARPALV